MRGRGSCEPGLLAKRVVRALSPENVRAPNGRNTLRINTYRAFALHKNRIGVSLTLCLRRYSIHPVHNSKSRPRRRLPEFT
jgi:hypothetical protein